MTDRLFVPLRSSHWRNFEDRSKDVELRGVNSQFNPSTVRVGRLVELRRGYSTDDSLWGPITERWVFDSAEEIADRIDHTRILPGATRKEFLHSVDVMLGSYDRFIPFVVDIDSSDHCTFCGSTDVVPVWDGGRAVGPPDYLGCVNCEADMVRVGD